VANLLKLFVDLQNDELVTSAVDSTPLNIPAFVQGDQIPVEVYLLVPDESGGFSSQFTTLNDNLTVKIGLVSPSSATSATAYSSATLSRKYRVGAAKPVDGGTGYTLNDELQPPLGAASEDPVLIVKGVASGVITELAVKARGIYATKSDSALSLTDYVVASTTSGGTCRVDWETFHQGTLDLNTAGVNNTLLLGDSSPVASATATLEIEITGTSIARTPIQKTVTVKADGIKSGTGNSTSAAGYVRLEKTTVTGSASMDSLALGNSSFIQLNNTGFSGNATLDGIAGGADGYYLNIFVNAYSPTQTLTINDDNSAEAGDGIKINDTSLVITGDGVVQLLYEGDEGAWQVMSARDTSGAE
jgi:hypothetical protein